MNNSDPTEMDTATMEIAIRNTLDSFLFQYLSASDSTATMDAGTYHDIMVGIAEDMVFTTSSTLSNWLVDVKRRRNRARTPIYRLPTEVLLTTLHLCVPSDKFQLEAVEALDDPDERPTAGYYKRLLCLCAVSPEWARVIRDTPSFWAYTSSWDHPKLTELILERSRTSLLWVECRAEDEARNDMNLVKYMEAVCAESHRWHTFILWFLRNDYDFLADLAPLGAASAFPKLSYLLIFGSDELRRITFPYYFKDAPLKYLQATLACLDWSTWPLSGLEAVHLTRNVILGPDLLRIRMTPSLKTLTLASTTFLGYPQDEAPTMSLSTPRLDHLGLYNITPAESMPMLLPHMAIHNISSVEIAVCFEALLGSQVNAQDQIHIIESTSQHLFQIIHPTLPIHLNISTSHRGRSSFEIGCEDGVFRVELTGSAQRIPELVEAICPELRSRPTLLKLDLASSQGAVVHGLKDRLNVVEVESDMGKRALFPMQSFARPSPPATWLFPDMSRMHLSSRCLFGRDADDIFSEMLAGLCEVAEARSDPKGSEVGKVEALQGVTLSGQAKIQKQDVERLQALVPEVKIGQWLEIVDRLPQSEMVGDSDYDSEY
ncbi:hypothetical protein FRB99_000592 [Tulasnella sp. 403]|nr:hypothetical protein FRB99_000592 [Tulasnella sp. 403]